MTWCIIQSALVSYVTKIKCGRPIAETVKDHNERDHKSHLLKHSLETGDERVKIYDFSIIYKKFSVNKRKWKIAESLLIKPLRPTLSIHDKSVPFKLLN